MQTKNKLCFMQAKTVDLRTQLYVSPKNTLLYFWKKNKEKIKQTPRLFCQTSSEKIIIENNLFNFFIQLIINKNYEHWDSPQLPLISIKHIKGSKIKKSPKIREIILKNLKSAPFLTENFKMLPNELNLRTIIIV